MSTLIEQLDAVDLGAPGITGRVDLDRFHYSDLTPYLIP